MKKYLVIFLALLYALSLAACNRMGNGNVTESANSTEVTEMGMPDNFVLINGGSFRMGSPE